MRRHGLVRDRAPARHDLDPAGAFADPAFPPPSVEVYEERRCPWLPDAGIPREW
jgi:hypothetical protein